MLPIDENNLEIFEILVKQYYDKVYKVVFIYSKDKWISEDAVQQAFVIAYNKLDQLRSKDRFFAWVSVIALNEAKRMLRIKSKEMMTSIEGYEKMARVSDEIDIDQKIDIGQTLIKLNQKETEILVLKYYADLTLKQIADLLSINLSNTKVRLHRTKEKFRKLIDENFN